jgi:hypothetical protein
MITSTVHAWAQNSIKSTLGFQSHPGMSPIPGPSSHYTDLATRSILEEYNFVIFNPTVLHPVVYSNLMDGLNNTDNTTKILVL